MDLTNSLVKITENAFYSVLYLRVGLRFTFLFIYLFNLLFLSITSGWHTLCAFYFLSFCFLVPKILLFNAVYAAIGRYIKILGWPIALILIFNII